MPFPSRLLVLAAAVAGVAGSPSCAVNGAPCALPTWEPTYNLTESSVYYVFFGSGLDPPMWPGDELFNRTGEFWGLLGIDWQISHGRWSSSGVPNTYNGQAVMIENCKQAKVLGQAKRCMIYENLEWAFQWHESERALMLDPAKKGYFVPWHDARGASNGTVFLSYYGDCTPCWRINSTLGDWGTCAPDLAAIRPRPGSWCYGAEFAWNLTTPEAFDEVLEVILAVVEGGGGFVDGLFVDDLLGFPTEFEGIEHVLNVSGTYDSGDLGALRNASQTLSQRLIDELVARGKYVWHAFGNGNDVGGNANNNTVNGTFFDSAHCTQWMTARCNTDFVNQRAIHHGADGPGKRECVHCSIHNCSARVCVARLGRRLLPGSVGPRVHARRWRSPRQLLAALARRLSAKMDVRARKVRLQHVQG